MVARGFCRKVVALCGQAVFPKHTYVHSCTGFHDGFPSCRVPASALASLHAATPASTAAVARRALSEGFLAATSAFRRKVCAARGAAGKRLAAPAISPAATGAEQHRVVVSYFRSSLTEISPRSRLKTGCALWLASGLVPLLLPFRLSPLLLPSEAVTLAIHSPLLTLPPAASSTSPAAAYYTAAARRTRAAAAPYEKGTAYYEGLPATHTKAPDKVPSQQVSRRPAVNYCNSSHSSGSSSVSEGRNHSTSGGTSSNNKSLDSSTSWYPGAQTALSRPRRASSPFSFISQLSSLPGRSWGVAARHTPLPAAAAAVATAKAAAYTTAGSATTTAISTAQATHSSHARRGTMASMGGFDPKDPHQAADVVLVPVLSDNYAYLLIDRETRKAACVDPAEPQKVLQAAAKEGVEISLCLCTHKHHDHSGGNVELAQKVPKIEIFGSGYEETPGVNRHLKNKDTVNLGDLRIEALHAPCHTSGHLLYFVTNARHPTLAPILFCGDTLFIGGCGRFFEGSAQQMHHALIILCGALPSNTRVYCGHEYTTTNLEFALTIEPDNQDLQAKYAWAKQQRSKGLPTIPSTLAQEKCYNPFMRTETNSVQSAVGALGDPNETMRLLRQKKDVFR